MSQGVSERLTVSSFDSSSGYLVPISLIALTHLSESLFVPLLKFEVLDSPINSTLDTPILLQLALLPSVLQTCMPSLRPP